MQRVIVTGCAGFIGWKVTEHLLANGHTVVGIDNLNDAYDVRLKQWRLSLLKGKPGFEFHRLDICDRDGLRRLFYSNPAIQTPQFDAVINLAARAGVRQSIENPWVYIDTNVTGTLNLLELCKECGIKKFVLASTSSLYGSGEVAALPRPFQEDANTNKPLSPYAASKKAAEALCYTYHHLFAIDITVVRYFTVYGPAGRPDMSLFRFAQWISEGRPVTVFGDGQQSRDFTYVDDIATGTAAALRLVGFEIINLGSDRPVVLMEAIRLVERLVNRTAKLDFQLRHPADVLATWADISKAERLLRWRPKIPFESGVEKLIEWYRENREWAKDITTE